MAVFTETIKLEDQVSGPAKAASNAVLDFGERMALAKAKTAEAKVGLAAAATGLDGVGGAAMRSAKPLENLTDLMLKSQGSAKLVAKADAQIVKQQKSDESEKAKASSKATAIATKNAAELANKMATVRDAVTSSVGAMRSAFTSLAAGDVKGAVQGITDSVAGMAKMLDLVVPGLGQAVSAVISIAGGLVGLTAGLIKSGAEFAISSNEAKKEMLGLFDAMGGGVVTGAKVEGVIDGLKAKFGISKDAMVEYTKTLMAMGRTDLTQLEGDLLAVSSAAALVKGGDKALLEMTKKIEAASAAGQGLKIPVKALAQLSMTGANVGDVAKVMGVSVEKLTADLASGAVDAKKFGDALNTAIVTKGQGPLERMGASSGNLKKLLDEAWGDLFEDIDVAPFMQEVKKLFDIFGQGTKSGETLKAGIGGFFKEVFATATRVVPVVKHFLLDMVILGLKAYIALKPIVKTIKEFVNSAAGASVISTVLSSIWGVLKVIGVAVLVVVAAAVILWGAMIAVSVAVWTAVGAVLGFVAGAGAALTGWVTTAATAAYDFVAGLVGGIANGASQVIGAVTGLAGKATGAFKSALGIASPSKVMQGMGGHMTDGVAEGLDTGASDVQAASSGVASASVKGMAEGGGGAGGGASVKRMAEGGGGAGGGASGGGGGAQISVTVLIDGAGKSALEITEEMVSSVFQRVALGAGA